MSGLSPPLLSDLSSLLCENTVVLWHIVLFNSSLAQGEKKVFIWILFLLLSQNLIKF